ncbi:MAG: Gfo/Idh/MocA family protein [Lachnospiraceae bacterium]
MIRAAVIGLGNIAGVHIEAIKAFPDGQLVAACDIDSERRCAVPQDVLFYTDYQQMMRENQLDVVHICLPHHLHTAAAKTATSLGINVFLEKPVGHTVDAAKELLGLEADYGVRLGVCFQNRYNPTSQALLQLLQSGVGGRVVGIRGIVNWYRSEQYYQEKPWRGELNLAGGGCMINQAIHTLDLMQWFSGSDASSVNGMTGNLLDYDISVEDTAIAKIDFANGVRGLFIATNACYQDLEIQLDVQCETFSYRIADGTLYQYKNGSKAKIVSDATGTVGKICYGNSHSLAIQQFYDVLCKRDGTYIGISEALKVQIILEAITNSSVSKKQVLPKLG